MSEALVGRCLDTFAQAADVHRRSGEALVEPLCRTIGLLNDALAAGHRVLICGNGGSAAESQHFAAELTGRFRRERAALPAIALTVDTSALTAIGNDYGFERVFARQVDAYGRSGDVLLAISTSGRSPNVVAAAEAASMRGMTVVALTGASSGTLGDVSDVVLAVPDADTARVQEVQLTLLHVLCDEIERAATTAPREP